MEEKFSIDMCEILRTITDTVDLVNPNVCNHHYKVSYVALELGKTLGLSDPEPCIRNISIIHGRHARG
ncbi:MAG: hypothetical protein ACLFN5_02180 [bacterium]